jgi:hypothetical protein
MIHVTINLPGAILPMERGERFEEPLMDAFEAEGIDAEWVGGGTALDEVDGRKVISSCDIELEVADLAVALPVIRRVLLAADAPEGTTIRHEDGVENLHSN